jgi:ketosteroid isomerase-like protein
VRFSIITPAGFAAVTLASVACAGGGATRADRTADSVAVATAFAQLIEGIRTNDLAATVGPWADDAVVMNLGVPTVRGRSALEVQVLARLAGSETSDLEVTVDEIAVHGDLAYLVARYVETIRASDGVTEGYPGRFLFLFRRGPDAGWKIIRAVGTDHPEP